MAAKKRAPRRKKVEPASRGLTPADMAGDPPDEIVTLQKDVERDGGVALGCYREPLDGRWLLLCALPLAQVEPTPYQRDLSEAHLKRLTNVIEKVGVFLDPIIATREGDKKYWTPNGNHRRAALGKLGAKSVTALVVPDREIAYRILALNTEKSHNLREKSLEVIRMARALAIDSDRKESEFTLEFEEPILLTLGVCYEKNGRFSGGAYRPALKRVESFFDLNMKKALAEREERGAALLDLDETVTQVIQKLKERGLQSPYLRSFVTARINPIRFAKEVTISAEELIKKMKAAALKFNIDKVTPEQVSSAGGWGGGDEESS
ncbi:MAG: ParB/RepB/Spo0J family partition protein [Planctomycetes bacterium]|nr:ParB/RepB/Spo0J family partition protein [Planctomycetota bacterium]